MQVPPSIKLAGFIRHYLFFDLAEAMTRPLRLFPDGSMGIVLNSSRALLWGSELLPASFFYGQITKYKELSSIAATSMIVIVFHPDGVSRMLDIPAHSLNDQVVALDSLFGERAIELCSSVAAADGWAAKLACIEHFLLLGASRQMRPADVLVSGALDVIQRHHGTISVQQLTSEIGCQSRQLERKFNVSVGLSPKQYCTIVRTLHFVKLLKVAQSGLTSASYDTGFYDQAHGIREFRKATGLTPSRYLKDAHSLALNFLVL